MRDTRAPWRAEPSESIAQGGVHRLSWADGTRILLDRFSEDKHGVVTAEITIKHDNSGRVVHLHQSRLNLTSSRTRESLAKTLEAQHPRTDSDMPAWVKVLEATCVLVLRQYREGEPMFEIGMEPPKNGGIEYAAYPLFLHQQPTIMYSEGGAGKTLTALYTELLIAAGVSANGITVPRPRKVAHLDWETDKETFNHYVWALKQGNDDLKDATIFYRRCYQGFVSDLAEIQRLVAEKGIEVLVLDSAMAGMGGDINDNALAMQYFNGLRALGVSALVIDHHGKDERGPIGASGKWTRARSVWELKPGDEDEAFVKRVGLFHRKMNGGMRLAPMGLEFTFIDEQVDGRSHLVAIDVKRVDIATDVDLASEQPVHKQIFQYLTHEGNKSVQEITAYLNDVRDVKRREKAYTDNYVRPVLAKYSKKGWFTRFPDGNYGASVDAPI